MTEEELISVQKYMREKFGNDQINLRDRTQADESVEVYLGDEFIGVIYRDEEDDEVSYDFNMAMLAIDIHGGEVANDEEILLNAMMEILKLWHSLQVRN